MEHRKSHNIVLRLRNLGPIFEIQIFNQTLHFQTFLFFKCNASKILNSKSLISQREKEEQTHTNLNFKFGIRHGFKVFRGDIVNSFRLEGRRGSQIVGGGENANHCKSRKMHRIIIPLPLVCWYTVGNGHH